MTQTSLLHFVVNGSPADSEFSLSRAHILSNHTDLFSQGLNNFEGPQ